MRVEGLQEDHLQEVARSAEARHVLLDKRREALLAVHPRLLQLCRGQQTFPVVDLPFASVHNRGRRMHAKVSARSLVRTCDDLQFILVLFDSLFSEICSQSKEPLAQSEGESPLGNDETVKQGCLHKAWQVCPRCSCLAASTRFRRSGFCVVATERNQRCPVPRLDLLLPDAATIA